MASLKELKEKVYKANIALHDKGLVSGTFGNASGIEWDKGVIAIKPSGVSYAELSPAKMVLVDLNNRVVESKLKPSSDTKSHIVLYKKFPKIGGVVHTHSTYATSWAQAVKPIPCLGTTHADYAPGEIPVTEPLSEKQIKRDYEEETGEQIVKRFKDISYLEVEMVLAANHGPFSWGATPEQAAYNSVVLEQIAKTALLTRLVDPKVKDLDKALLEKHWGRKHGKGKYYGQG